MPEPTVPPQTDEGGVVFSHHVYTAKGLLVCVTARGKTVEEAIDKFMAGLRYAAEKYQWKAAPATPPAAGTRPPATGQRAAQPPASVPQSKPNEVEGQKGETLRAVKMVVTPLSEGKVKLEFYGTGTTGNEHKFPDIVAQRTLPLAVNMLAEVGAWTEDLLSRPSEYTVDYAVEWVYGKLKQNSSNRYRNVTRVRLPQSVPATTAPATSGAAVPAAPPVDNSSLPPSPEDEYPF